MTAYITTSYCAQYLTVFHICMSAVVLKSIPQQDSNIHLEKRVENGVVNL